MASVRTGMGSIHILPGSFAVSWLPFLGSMALKEQRLLHCVCQCGSQLSLLTSSIHEFGQSLLGQILL